MFSSSARQGGTDTTEADARAPLDVAGPSGGTTTGPAHRSRPTPRRELEHGLEPARVDSRSRSQRDKRSTAGVAGWLTTTTMSPGFELALGDGACPTLENSTACQKSMPMLCCWPGWFLLLGAGPVDDVFLWLMLEFKS